MRACSKIMEIIRLTCILTIWFLTAQCSHKPASTVSAEPPGDGSTRKPSVAVGADQLDILLPKLRNKNIALVVNHTSLVGNTHLTDTLMSSGVTIKKVFAPEHGFRGAAADGEKINDGTDSKTGLPIVSLYGANRKPTPEQLADIDLVIF